MAHAFIAQIQHAISIPCQLCSRVFSFLKKNAVSSVAVLLVSSKYIKKYQSTKHF